MRQAEVVARAAAAVGLHRPVDDLAGHVRYRHLDHRDLGAGDLVAHRIHAVRGVQRQQPRLLDQDARLGDSLDRHPLLGDRRAEGHPRQPGRHIRSSARSGQADLPHTVVDAPRAEPALGNLEAAAFAQAGRLDAGTRTFLNSTSEARSGMP